MITGNESVFPLDETKVSESRLTIRQEFASKIMQGLMSDLNKGEYSTWEILSKVNAQRAVISADALILELNKKINHG